MAVQLRAVQWGPAAVLGLICIAVGVLAGIDPTLAVFAALGMVFVAITFSDLAVGVVVLVVVVFGETTPIAGPALSFTKLAGLLLAMAWLALLATRSPGADRILLSAHPIFSYLLLAFLGWVAISISWTDSPSEGVVQGSRLLLVATLYAIVYTAVGSRRDAMIILGGFTAGTAAVAAYGLIRRPSVGDVVEERLVSTVNDPNVLASFLVAGLALGTAAFLAARGWRSLRLAAGSAALLCLGAFVLTGSRGGLVAGVAALIAGVVFGGPWRMKAIVAAVVILLGGATFYALYAPEDVRDRITAASQGQLERSEGRLTLWTVGWRMAEDNFVTGVGIGSFKSESIRYVLEPGRATRTDRVIDQPGTAHNTYLLALAEIGVVGLTLYLAIVGFSVWAAFAAAREFRRVGDWRMELLTRGLIVAVAGMLAANFFITQLSGKLTWLLLALGPALLGLARRAEGAIDADHDGGPGEAAPDNAPRDRAGAHAYPNWRR